MESILSLSLRLILKRYHLISHGFLPSPLRPSVSPVHLLRIPHPRLPQRFAPISSHKRLPTSLSSHPSRLHTPNFTHARFLKVTAGAANAIFDILRTHCDRFSVRMETLFRQECGWVGWATSRTRHGNAERVGGPATSRTRRRSVRVPVRPPTDYSGTYISASRERDRRTQDARWCRWSPRIKGHLLFIDGSQISRRAVSQLPSAASDAIAASAAAAATTTTVAAAAAAALEGTTGDGKARRR